MSASEKYRLAVTMGDPAGIGPEVILKALGDMDERAWESREITLYGAREVFEREDAELKAQVADYRSALSRVAIVEVAPGLTWEDYQAGRPDERGAVIQGEALQRAVADVKEGAQDGIVTAPWNKALFGLIGQPPVGHTEVLAEAFGANKVVMMLAGPRLRVALLTTHVALAEVAGLIRGDRLEETLEVVLRSLRQEFRIPSPRVGICALNPHAGEEGTMGREELEVLAPALERARSLPVAEGAELDGPLPADTLFAKFAGGRQPYDAVLAMYHDQGLIPLKLMHFGESANITLGLPAVRTSVDHGTAYDIAGQGIADQGSMAFALEAACDLIRARRSR